MPMGGLGLSAALARSVHHKRWGFSQKIDLL